jgi:hypothetical protein
MYRLLFLPCEEVSLEFGSLELEVERHASFAMQLGRAFLEIRRKDEEEEDETAQ